jgi:type II secretory pathway predicted ATPase ExeA
MYHEFFGLRCNPFQLAPSTEFFFASRSHREALAALHWGLSDPTGLVLLTGDVGTGKTTVIRELFSRDTRAVATALVKNPKLSFEALVAGILRQLGVDAPEDRAAMLDALQRTTEQRRIVVVIDEAQQLSNESLEEFRLLCNSSPEGFQLMLVGQPELLERLASPDLRQLNQRIAVRAVLNPLGPAETIDYLRHRIRAAGGETARIFTKRALSAIARWSGGIPRRVNILAHNALLLAYSGGSRKVRSKHVRAALEDYDRSSIKQAAPKIWNSRVFRQSLAPALLLVAAMVLGVVGIEPGRGHKGPQAANPATQRKSGSTRTVDVLPAPDRTAIIHSPKTDPMVQGSEPAAGIRPTSEAVPVRHSSKVSLVLPAGEPRPATEPRQVLPNSQVAASIHAVGPSGSSNVDDGAEQPSVSGADAAGNRGEIVVQRGDTLSAIAQRYSEADGKIDLHLLIAANPEIKDANLIYPGEKIRLQPK